MAPFFIIDAQTLREADIEKIAMEEDWARGLIHCDMEGFAVMQDGRLILMDECGSYKRCPENRFQIVYK